MEFPAVSAASGWGSAGLGGEYVAGDLAGRDGSSGSGVAPAAQQFASGGVKASCHGLVEVGWGSAHREAGSSVIGVIAFMDCFRFAPEMRQGHPQNARRLARF